MSWLLKLFSIEALLKRLSEARETPEGKIAEALIRANNPEKAAMADAVLKVIKNAPSD